MTAAVLCAGSGIMPQARLVDAITGFDATAPTVAALPAKLSATGLYANITLKTRAVTEGIVPFEVNSALWSDGSHKARWITVPAGTSITPTDSDYYAFPEKTVLIKNFAIDTIVGDTTSRIIVETRFLVVSKSGSNLQYKGISYAWNREQTDADLVNQITGLNKVINITKGGKSVGKRWQYPSRSACNACHLGRGSLGFITPQLNRPSKANPSINQLADLFAKGVLNKNPLAANPNSIKWAALNDGTASLEVRARSWLAANCSHCHGNGNKQILVMYHDFDYLNKTIPYAWNPTGAEEQPGYMGRSAKTGSDEHPYIMKAGYPDSSLSIKRMITRGGPDVAIGTYDQMPWLATFQPDSAAVRVVADWICSVGSKPTGAACKIPDVVQPKDPDPTRLARHARIMTGQGGIVAFIAGGKLYVQAPLRASAAAVAAPKLVDAAGKAVPIAPAGKETYALPAGLPPGAYFLQWRGETIPVTSGI